MFLDCWGLFWGVFVGVLSIFDCFGVVSMVWHGGCLYGGCLLVI